MAFMPAASMRDQTIYACLRLFFMDNHGATLTSKPQLFFRPVSSSPVDSQLRKTKIVCSGCQAIRHVLYPARRADQISSCFIERQSLSTMTLSRHAPFLLSD